MSVDANTLNQRFGDSVSMLNGPQYRGLKYTVYCALIAYEADAMGASYQQVQNLILGQSWREARKNKFNWCWRLARHWKRGGGIHETIPSCYWELHSQKDNSTPLEVAFGVAMFWLAVGCYVSNQKNLEEFLTYGKTQYKDQLSRVVETIIGAIKNRETEGAYGGGTTGSVGGFLIEEFAAALVGQLTPEQTRALCDSFQEACTARGISKA
jgi:hypothetical protein